MDASIFRERYGPWALVAGGSQGLGAEFAAQLAALGINLVLVARNLEQMQALAARFSTDFNIQVRLLQADLAEEQVVEQIIAQTSDLEIGLLIYNAAYSAIGPFLEIPLEDHLREINTNIRAPLALAYHLGRRMRQRKPRQYMLQYSLLSQSAPERTLPKRGGIVLMASLSSIQGSALVSNYAATKAYNAILAEGMWEELREQGIDVLACWAGAISTPNYQKNLPGAERSLVAGTSPREVARATLDALGKRPSIIPGAGYRMAAFVMQRLLPRPMAIRLMGRMMRRMYAG